MCTFEEDLVRLCMTEALKAQGDQDASTEVAHTIVGTLASAIALMMGGSEQGCVAVASIIAADLPRMAAQRASSFRETFGPREPTGRTQ